MDYFPDAERFAVGCSDGTIRVYHDIKRHVAFTYDQTKKHSNSILAVKCYEDYVLSCGWDNFLKIWDPRSEEMIDSIYVSCPFKDAVDYNGGNYIIVGSFEQENHIKVYDVRKSNGLVSETTVESQTVLGKGLRKNDRQCKIHALNFCKFDKSKLICSTVHNNTVKLLDFNGGDVSEVWSYEALKNKVMSVDTAKKEKKVWFSGVGVHGEIDFDYKDIYC